MTRYRHVEHGFICEIVGVATIVGTGAIRRGQTVITYRSEGGSLFVCPIEEFADGSFEMIEPVAPAKTDFVPAADE